MKQGFGRYASTQETGSAESPFGFDQDNLHSLVRGQKGRCVTARSASNNNQLSLHFDFLVTLVGDIKSNEAPASGYAGAVVPSAAGERPQVQRIFAGLNNNQLPISGSVVQSK
jgi:hypothetical protein